MASVPATIEKKATSVCPAPGGGAGVMQVRYGGSDGATLQDFDVERYQGCYFIKF